MGANEKYEVFISYSRADYLDEHDNVIKDSAVNAIVKALDKHGVSYWIDVHKGDSQNEYMDKIAKAINKSKALLFVSSEKSNSLESYWPIKEVLYASENKKTIIPIKIDNAKYNEKIGLALAGLEMIEYHKNQEQSISKLLKMLKPGIKEDPDPVSLMEKLKKYAKVGLLGLLICFLFVSVFALIGYCDGYFSNRVDVEQAMKNAFRENKISFLDSQTVLYKGQNLEFQYDLDTDVIITIHSENRKFWDRISVMNVMASASLSYAFSRLAYNAKFISDGKSKFYYFVVGTVGILCGYTLGQYVGEDAATCKNEIALRKYFTVHSNRETFREWANRIYR